MSTAAAAPSLPTPAAAGSASSLLVGSLLGAVVVLAGFVAAGFAAAAVPDSVPYLEVVRVALYLVVVGVGVAVGGFLAGRNPAPGVSGGIILTVSIVIAAAFIASAFAANLKDNMFGPILAGVTIAGGGFGVYRLLTSQTGIGWCRAIDSQGWTHFDNHKPSQGKMVRRFTMVGILVLGISGAWALWAAQPFNEKKAPAATTAEPVKNDTPAPATSADKRQDVPPPLEYQVPFVEGKKIALIPVANYTLPALIGLFTVWAAWRAVNVPTFGDFLIATEAEMNKVSWTTRKQLIRDTLVVLVFLLLLTLFLFVIDAFWQWLLSMQFIGVLPNKEASIDATGGKASW